MIVPIRHRTCGRTICEVRYVIADDGDPAFVAWCPKCACAPAGDDLTRPLLISDVRAYVLAHMIPNPPDPHVH